METLREQVADAIASKVEIANMERFRSDYAVTIAGINEAADAAIKAVLDKLKCETCSNYQHFHADIRGWCKEYDGYPSKDYGCVYWNERS